MGNKSVSAKVSNNKGDELSIKQHETDSPVIPVQQLETLHQFRLDRV